VKKERGFLLYFFFAGSKPHGKISAGVAELLAEKNARKHNLFKFGVLLQICK
jgi:hypothetical protein